jgi:DNA-binding response OmpR family regulator
MVVDDDEDTQAFMRAVLSRRYTVITAGCEAEARSELANHAVNLVLMDLSLGNGEDGANLTRRLRGEKQWQQLPIVALTAHASAADRERALDAGCNDYVVKPIERRRLFALIDALIGQR